jgi:hypothetical protein
MSYPKNSSNQGLIIWVKVSSGLGLAIAMLGQSVITFIPSMNTGNFNQPMRQEAI